MNVCINVIETNNKIQFLYQQSFTAINTRILFIQKFTIDRYN